VNLKFLHSPGKTTFVQAGIARRTLFLRCPPGFSFLIGVGFHPISNCAGTTDIGGLISTGWPGVPPETFHAATIGHPQGRVSRRLSAAQMRHRHVHDRLALRRGERISRVAMPRRAGQ
jgi:hypothetical protein